MRKYTLSLLILAVGLVAGVVYLKQGNPSSPEKASLQQPVERQPAEAPQLSESEMEKLGSLPYTNWSSARTDVTKFGVVRYDRARSLRGMNLYNSRNLSRAHLMNMEGKFIHSWAVPMEGNDSWHTVQAMKDGSLFAIVKDHKLIKLSRDSGVEWEYNATVHHDLAVADGLIYVPTRRPEMWTTGDFKIPVVKEYITVLTEQGKFLKEFGLFEALSPFLSPEQIQKIQAWAMKEDIPARLSKKGTQAATWWENKKADVFHVNSIQLIDRNIRGIVEKGDILLSVRQLDLVCIFRPRTGKLVWSWGPGEIQCQHHATLLENDNILLFDNGCKRRYSRAIEVNVRSKQIVWQYRASSPAEFFSHRRGGVQRLPNGNTLITESDRGRIFEITPEGEIVWEFLNPDVSSEKKRRAVVYRMVRVPENFLNKQ